MNNVNPFAVAVDAIKAQIKTVEQERALAISKFDFRLLELQTSLERLEDRRMVMECMTYGHPDRMLAEWLKARDDRKRPRDVNEDSWSYFSWEDYDKTPDDLKHMYSRHSYLMRARRMIVDATGVQTFEDLTKTS